MSLIKWRPFLEPFDEMEKFFEDFPSLVPERFDGFIPSVDIYEQGKNVIIESPLAGVEVKDVDILIDDNNILTIKGSTQRKKEIEEKDFYRKEVKHGSFYRSFRLPKEVIKDKAEAISENGILKIIIPKIAKEKKKEKVIKIKVKNKKK